MPYDLVVLGDLVADVVLPIDRLPLRPNEHGWADGLFVELGGSCTTLVAARRLGLSTTVLATIGDDEYGHQVRAMLADEGVDVRYVALEPGRKTVLCVVVTDRAGQHVFLGIKDGLPPPPLRSEWESVIRDSRTLFTTGYTLRDILRPEEALAALELAREARTTVYFDPGPSLAFLTEETLTSALALTDVLLLTEDEADQLVEETAPERVARALHRYGPSVIVLKAGAKGCYVSTEGEVIYQPSFEVQVVDTVGAGDAFGAAFIAGRLRGGTWRECAALANAMGAAMAATRGAGRSVPQAASLRELLGTDSAARLLTGDSGAEDTP